MLNLVFQAYKEALKAYSLALILIKPRVFSLHCIAFIHPFFRRTRR